MADTALKDALDLYGMTTMELSNALDVAPLVAKAYVEGWREIDEKTARQLAVLFGLPPDFWIEADAKERRKRRWKRR
ncbi:MAG: hypothetical protein HUK22_06935 [Thermoguttaceae bacterium]|nr:hypothetical protein [Thermoguttaceae bacterium]